MHTAAGGAGQLLQGACCFDTNQESGMLRLGTSQRCQELEGHAPVSRKRLSRNRAHLHPESPASPSTRSAGLRLSGCWEPSPSSPPSFLPFSCEASATMCLTLSSQKTSRHILGREMLPKPGWSYLLPAETDGAGLAAASKLPSPVLGSGAHGRCGDPSAWLNPIPSSSISHPPSSTVRDCPGSTGLLGESSVKTHIF